MKYLSLFSGIGGFELGIQYANLRPLQSEVSERPKKQHNIKNKLQQWKCVGYSEIDKYAVQIYEKHFNHKNYGDTTKINTKQLPDFDLLVGGFPCQAFSIAGKRKGFDDTRGTLFFDIARILADKRPRYFVLENVKGLLSHDQGKTFQTILGVLTDLGYDYQWQVLNSKNFGVPQNRERVFIIGHIRGTSRPEVFPLTGSNPKIIKRFQGDVSGKGYTSQQDRIYFPDGVMGTLPATRTENKCNIFQPVLTPDRLKKRQNGRRFKNDGEPSFTLTGQDIHGIKIDSKIRRLTPTECERLQGFPDGWTEGVSDTQRYKTLGNAVTVNVIKAIMESLF